MSSDDLLASARIRNTALELFGDQGYARTTIRQVAERAGVSPGLVIHHFRSKDGLRDAVNDWVIEVLRTEKAAVLALAQPQGMTSYLSENPELRPLTAYLSTVLREGGPMADHLFDLMVDVTREVLDTAAAAGVMNPPRDPETLIPMLVAYGCGAAMLGPQLARHYGGVNLLDAVVQPKYTAAALEIFTHPLLRAEAFGAAVETAQADPTREGNPT